MPLYDFECDACERKESDVLRKNNEPYRCSRCHEDCQNGSTQYGMMQPKITAPSRTSSRWGDTNSNRI